MYSVLDQKLSDKISCWLSPSPSPTVITATCVDGTCSKKSVNNNGKEKEKKSYIVIGAGAAGSVVAARLAEDPEVNVLVIEMGPNNYGNEYVMSPVDASLMWDNPLGPKFSPSSLSFETSKQLDRHYTYPRGTGAGGSSNHHSLVDGRGSHLIYDNIAKLVNDDIWCYNNVLQYYKKMERYYGNQTITYDNNEYHGSDGWLSVRPSTVKSPFHLQLLNVCHEITGANIRNDMSGPPEQADGVGLIEVQVTEDGKRSYPFGDLLIPTMNKNKNIVVLFNTLTTKVLFDDCNTAIGVNIIHKPNAYYANKSSVDCDNNNNNNKQFETSFYCNTEVIISCGAINTPQLLMLSGVGPADHLQQMGINVIVDSPGVGSNLMDHHEVNVVYEFDFNKIVWPSQAASLLNKLNQLDDDNSDDNCNKQFKQHLQQFANLDPNSVESREPAGGIVLDWYSGLPTDIGHDLHIDHGQGFFFDFDLSSNKPLPDGKVRTDYEKAQTDIYKPKTYFHSLIEVLRPTSATGSIRLASSDPCVQPIIDLGLYDDDPACERLAHGILMIRDIYNHPTIKHYCKLDDNGLPLELFPSYKYKSIDELKCYIKSWSSFGHHISGTAAMNSVTNSRLQVIGTNNLRVVDTSIYPFPYLHGYNTSRGAYLIGEMAADIIRC